MSDYYPLMTTRKAITVVLPAVAIAAAVMSLVAGCGKYAEPFRDAPTGARNTGSADTANMPDGFSNFASKCDHGNRVYVLYKGDAAYGGIDVVPNDPSCK